MRNFLAFTISIMMMVLPSKGHANAWCAGTISNTLTYSSGEVIVLGSWRGAWTSICNVKQEWKGIPPEVCYVWFSHVSNAITEDKAVTIYYTSIDQAECSTMGTYGSAPAPDYVLLAK